MNRTYRFSETNWRIKCAPGCVAVEMGRKEPGVLARVDDGEVSSCVAKVVAVGDPFVGYYLGKSVVSDPRGLQVGDVVLIDAWRGFILDGFGWDVVSNETIRVFGSNGGPGSFVPFQRYAYDEGILGKMVGEELQAVGNRVTLKLGPFMDDHGGVLLTDRQKRRDPVCEVLSVGEMVDFVKPGDKVLVSQNAVFEVDGEVKLQDIGTVYADAILAVMSD